MLVAQTKDTAVEEERWVEVELMELLGVQMRERKNQEPGLHFWFECLNGGIMK